VRSGRAMLRHGAASRHGAAPRHRAAPPHGAALMLLAALVFPVAFPARALAQDFAGPAPAGPPAGPAGFLESGLPPAPGAAFLELTQVALTGTPELTTRALALGGTWRGVGAAAGYAQTGDAALGWDALALACGAARVSAAVALRALARRDRSEAARVASPDRGVGGEIGGGAWVRCGAAVRVWASAPQLWTRGAAPPLARALVIGVRIGNPIAAAWLAREAAPAGWRIAGDHVGGLSLGAGAVSLWLEARDRPLRGALGAGASLGFVRVTAAVESHPVLGETARLAIAFARSHAEPGEVTPSAPGATPP